MFIDRAVVEVRSGKGGDGAIAFLREKFMPNGGPAGGNGGRGASVIFRANSHINTLINFRHSKTFIGPDGEKGGIKNQYGKSSQDIIVDDHDPYRKPILSGEVGLRFESFGINLFGQ